MARYTGANTKIARKFGEPIFGPDKSYEKKNYPPGQHGLAKKRKKRNRRLNILMDSWRDSSEIYTTRHQE
jgi:small subunit ribosomal protein S4